MTPDIKEEWDKHQSIFALRWRRRMVAKGKFVFLKEVSGDKELWDKIDQMAGTDRQRAEMFKDLRLLEAAIAYHRSKITPIS
jgi:CRISPR/Cas system CSM-associated protein Csm2 small subunit